MPSIQDTIIGTDQLPATMQSFFATKTVRISSFENELRILPNEDSLDSPLIGLLEGTHLSVDHFLDEKLAREDRCYDDLHS
jgi:hypothetical protein